MEFDFIGCGALNWDLFFEVESLWILQDVTIFRERKGISPGRELVLERKEFLEVLKFLEKRARFVFECGGGSAANTIYALGLWGFKCAFIGAVGEDSFGKKILEEFGKVNIQTDLVFRTGENSLALIILDENKDRFILVSPGNSEKFLTGPLALDQEFPVGIYHLSSFATSEGRGFQRALLETKDKVFSFDPGEVYVNLGFDNLRSWFEKTTYLFITQEELKLLGKTPQELISLGIKKIFVKRGKKGATLYAKDKILELPAIEIKNVVDNTGAGDYFDAGVLAGIKLGLKEESILQLGIYSAGMSLCDYGRKGCLNFEEFQKYVSLLK